VTGVPALVIAGPGTNRDPDVAFALELAGAVPTVVGPSDLRYQPHLLSESRVVVVAGGFSHADALGAGRLLALDLTAAIGDGLHDFVDRGGLLLGICNGFQVLTRAGLLPGALGHNQDGHFVCRWVSLAAEPSCSSPWTAGLEAELHCPIAHGEGRYVHPDPDGLAAAGQVALRYADGNPNGSVADIAGVCDPTGRVLGLMPHPENHVLPRQHPLHRTGGPTAANLGLRLFEQGVTHARES
jgi:phosphoribosylformylglycinamidine synthase subunit PurQ / glutaminase